MVGNLFHAGVGVGPWVAVGGVGEEEDQRAGPRVGGGDVEVEERAVGGCDVGGEGIAESGVWGGGRSGHDEVRVLEGRVDYVCGADAGGVVSFEGGGYEGCGDGGCEGLQTEEHDSEWLDHCDVGGVMTRSSGCEEDGGSEELSSVKCRSSQEGSRMSDC